VAVKMARQPIRPQNAGYLHHGEKRGEDAPKRFPMLLHCQIPIHAMPAL
jgi:hypothetical protein